MPSPNHIKLLQYKIIFKPVGKTNLKRQALWTWYAYIFESCAFRSYFMWIIGTITSYLGKAWWDLIYVPKCIVPYSYFSLLPIFGLATREDNKYAFGRRFSFLVLGIESRALSFVTCTRKTYMAMYLDWQRCE